MGTELTGACSGGNLHGSTTPGGLKEQAGKHSGMTVRSSQSMAEYRTHSLPVSRPQSHSGNPKPEAGATNSSHLFKVTDDSGSDSGNAVGVTVGVPFV